MARRIKHVGRGHVEHEAHERAYVALRHLRWGAGYLEPGDPVPIEGGRDYGAMVRGGLIQQTIAANTGEAA